MKKLLKRTLHYLEWLLYEEWGGDDDECNDDLKRLIDEIKEALSSAGKSLPPSDFSD